MRVAGSSGKRASTQRAADELREITRELEGELTSVMERLSTEESKATAAERRAIAAIKRGDDGDAHAALIEQGSHVTEMRLLDADARILQSLLDEIREFLDEHSVTPPT